MRPQQIEDRGTRFALPIRPRGYDRDVSAEEMVNIAAADMGGLDRVRSFASFGDLILDNMVYPAKRFARWQRRHGDALCVDVWKWARSLDAQFGYPDCLFEADRALGLVRP